MLPWTVRCRLWLVAIFTLRAAVPDIFPKALKAALESGKTRRMQLDRNALSRIAVLAVDGIPHPFLPARL